MSKLGLNDGGGAYIRFSPSVNAWQFGGAEIELKQFAFDFDGVKTGWGKLSEGNAPEWVWDEVLGRKPPIPSDEKDAKGNPVWKRGFAVKMFLKEHGPVEWSSNGTGPVMGLGALYDLCDAGRTENPGKIPVVEYLNSEAKKVGKGQTRIPNFKVVKWLDAGAVDFNGEAPPPSDEAKAKQIEAEAAAKAKAEADAAAAAAKAKAAPKKSGDEF